MQQPELTMWMTYLAEDSLKQLLSRIRFAESVEMLSVYACVLNDSSLLTWPLDDMMKREGEIRKARGREMRKLKEGGYEMCPALLVTSVLSERLQ